MLISGRGGRILSCWHLKVERTTNRARDRRSGKERSECSVNPSTLKRSESVNGFINILPGRAFVIVDHVQQLLWLVVFMVTLDVDDIHLLLMIDSLTHCPFYRQHRLGRG